MKNELNKQVGVWLDHTKAHFIDVSKGPAIIETVFSDKESNVRFKGEHGNGIRLGNYRSTNNESHQHNRKKEIEQEYFKILVDRLKNYDDILLLGSTKAKEELYNILNEDTHFRNKRIKLKSTDRLTENQMKAEVKHFFDQ